MNSLPPPNSPPTLEALLKLKRAERPSPEFWAEFEQGLRQKQLAAIVEPKPWWLGASFALRKPAPWVGGLVAGAAAVFMVSVWPTENGETAAGPKPLVVASDNGYGAPELSLVAEATERVVSSSVREIATSEALGASETDFDDLRAGPKGEASRSLSETDGFVFAHSDDLQSHNLADQLLEAASAAVSSFVVRDKRVVSGETLLAAVGTTSSGPSLTPVAATSESFSVEDPVFSLNQGVLGSLATTGELAQSDGPQEKSVSGAVNPRQARLLASVSESGATSSLQALAKVRDQVIHRMGGDDELYASISRLGVSGDRLSVRF